MSLPSDVLVRLVLLLVLGAVWIGGLAALDYHATRHDRRQRRNRRRW